MAGETAFGAWQKEIFARHGAGEFREALNVLSSPPPDLTPAQWARADFWAACLRATLGEPEAAVEALERVRDRGDWFAPVLLERDADLSPIRDHPRFVALLAAWRERQRVEAGRHQPSLTLLEPEGTPSGTLIALHGNAGTSEALRSHYADLAGEGWRVALAGSGQYGGPEAFVWDDAAQADAEAGEWTRGLGGRPIWAGFSAGAGVALRNVITGAVPASGVLAVAPSLAADLRWWPESPAQVPVALVLGEADPHTARALVLAERLRAVNAPVREWMHAGGHTHPKDWETVRAGALAWLAAPPA
ncbi:hypothetical protein V3W47_13275 [Deinococcus sp. YIM 134068]|uniref:TPR end-of-group domain-containing protein n=1 Tax=Deinococcus lichenicola TaxID=3118910 RepID=UPI002F94EAE7